LTTDGKQALLAYSTGIVELYDLRTGDLVRKWLAGGVSWAISPDSKLLLCGGMSGISLSDMATGEITRRFYDGKSEFHAVAFSPDGKSIVAGSEDGFTRIWDLRSTKVTRVFPDGRGQVRCAAFSPDGRYILSADAQGGPLRLRSLASGAVVRQFGEAIPETPSSSDSPGDWYRAVAFSPTGRYVLSGGFTGLRLWEVASGKKIMQLGEMSAVNTLALTADGKRALAGYVGGSLELWDLRTGAQLRLREGERSDVQSLALTPDGKVAVVFDGGSVFVWSVTDWKVKRIVWRYPTNHND
jgi:WD40 repeat protein